MAGGIHQISGSFVQSGSLAQFISGIEVTGSISTNAGITAQTFIGNGSGLTNLNFGTSTINLFVGSASNTVPPTFGSWVTGSVDDFGNALDQEITLSTSSSGGQFNHFTFLRNSNGTWIEPGNAYTETLNGLIARDSLTETLGTGIHRYLLLAMTTESKQTVVEGTTVIINPDQL